MSPKWPCLVLCGSQTIPPPPEALQDVRAQLRNEPDLQGLGDVIRELPGLWGRLVEANSLLGELPEVPIQAVGRWLDGEDYDLQIPSTLPNVLLAPITVIIHIVQYLQFLSGLYDDNDNDDPHAVDPHARVLQSASIGGFQGLCTGFLSAAVLAHSADKRQIVQNAQVAVRLATCIGAYVDLDLKDSPGTGCLIAQRGPSMQVEDLDEVLGAFSEVYVSVELDDRSVTITAPAQDMSSLRCALAEKGFKLTEIPLRGRYHTISQQTALQELKRLAVMDPSLLFSQTSRLLAPLRDNSTGKALTPNEPLHEICLRCLLTERADWRTVMTETAASLAFSTDNMALELGLSGSPTRSLSARLSLQIISPGLRANTSHNDYHYPDHSVAIIGAAGQFAGAETLDEMWHIIRTGASMASKPPRGRFECSSTQAGCIGNYMENAAQFDHEFFGISPREAKYMDPQQRIALQCAYHAVESSGYFGQNQDKRARNIGCYVGVAGSDYDHNLASHSPTAFSYTGTSRAFVAGRISHNFGWDGPAMTIDTACSSSAVAIHQACKDLAIGECSMALAGGVNVISSPKIHENLQAARFLDPSGPCRSFEAGGKGYCRGEGCGYVLLKRLFTAIADGDEILGVIVGSGTSQCEGNSAITVPSSSSQVNLQRKVLSSAGMRPSLVSYIEAHGTGTPKGDPIECQTIRQVFGRGASHPTLHLGTVKANIGHTEAASGVAALLKVVLMMRHAQIPPQANFRCLNPSIPSLEDDHIAIATGVLPWRTRFHAACVNNYGASGNNAAILLCEAPRKTRMQTERDNAGRALQRYPFLLAARSETSLRRYCAALLKSPAMEDQSLLPHLAFHVARRQNRTHPHRAVLMVESMSNLRQQLATYANGTHTPSLPVAPKEQRPVVLVFAGQGGNDSRLSREAYEGSTLLQSHLNRCDGLLQNQGQKSIFPDIFSVEPIEDVVLLHSIIFSVQYACAASWIDSGLPIKRVIGHSIGQLTAMCVAGVISLSDALKLIVGRASLVREKWGADRGCMLAVDISRQEAQALIHSLPGHRLEVACFNAPHRQVLVGTEAAIQAVEAKITAKAQRLKITYGYHSSLMDGLMEEYEALAESITYAEPQIAIETCSETSSWSRFTPTLVAEHSRAPVFFWEAVRRIVAELGQCSWVEGGTSSTGVSLVRSALGPAIAPGHSFHGVQLGTANTLEKLAQATAELWCEGFNVQFWPYHPCEGRRHPPLPHLPGYQFDATHHWLPYIDQASRAQTEKPLLFMAPSATGDPNVFDFIIDQSHAQYRDYLQGRKVLDEWLCPASLYVELAAQALDVISPATASTPHTLQFMGMEMRAALGCMDTDKLSLQLRKDTPERWTMVIESQTGMDATLHATGSLCSNYTQSQLPTMKAPIKYSLCERILSNPCTASVQGNLVYRILDRIADYTLAYRGIQSISIADREAVAHVQMPEIALNHVGQQSRCNPPLLDQFMVIAEIHALSLETCRPSEAFMCCSIGGIITYTNIADASGPWTVYTRHSGKDQAELICDTFVFDNTTKAIVVAISQARYVKIQISSLRMILDRAKGVAKAESVSLRAQPKPKQQRPQQQSHGRREDVAKIAGQLIYEITGISSDRFSGNTPLLEAGVDSLAVTELESSIRNVFNVDISIRMGKEDLSFGSLCSMIEAAGSLVTTSNSNSPSESTPQSSQSSAMWQEDHNRDDLFQRLAQVVVEYLNTTEPLHHPLHPETQLQSLGLDLRLAMELEANLYDVFGVKIDLIHLSPKLTLDHLAKLLQGCDNSPSAPAQTGLDGREMDQFSYLRHEIGSCAQTAGFTGFYEQVFPRQRAICAAYVVEAFAQLGCVLQDLAPGQPVPPVHHIPRHSNVVSHYHVLLEDHGLIAKATGPTTGFVRTSQPVSAVSSAILHQELVSELPLYRSENELLHCTGARLADCLSGQADPLNLLFGSPQGVSLMQDVYKNTPMFKMGTLMLGHFLTRALSSKTGVLHILEIGAGTGGTTEYILEQLTARGIRFRYTFTDISPALVARARKTFAKYGESIEYMALDIEGGSPASPSADGGRTYDIIVSSNCIHATKNIGHSCRNIYRLLRPNGLLCLLELTRDLWWLDCVFGLLRGWWLFEDGRQHVLADEQLWKRTLLGAGFEQVDWSNDETRESDVFRLIVAS